MCDIQADLRLAFGHSSPLSRHDVPGVKISSLWAIQGAGGIPRGPPRSRGGCAPLDSAGTPQPAVTGLWSQAGTASLHPVRLQLRRLVLQEGGARGGRS